MSVIQNEMNKQREVALETTAQDRQELQEFAGKAAAPIKRAVVNHKVEQIIRAMYLGLELQNVNCTTGTCTENFNAQEWIRIGTADHLGIRLDADSCTRLIMMGYHPSAVLVSLTRMRFNGKPVVAIKDNALIAMHGAVAQNARDHVFNKAELLTLYKSTGKPKNFA